MTLKQYKAAQAILARTQAGLPADETQARIALRLPLLKLANQVSRECAPAIAASREREEFFASGKSLVGWLKEKATNAPLPAWARVQAPPLPVGLPMPPNTCNAPAFNV